MKKFRINRKITIDISMVIDDDNQVDALITSDKISEMIKTKIENILPDCVREKIIEDELTELMLEEDAVELEKSLQWWAQLSFARQAELLDEHFIDVIPWEVGNNAILKMFKNETL